MTQPQALQKLVKDVSTQLRTEPVTIAVIGDMILDNSIEGEPRGFHPETQVPILGDATSQESIGGAANIATALQKLGCDVTLFGVVGSDLPGRQLENLLDRQPFTNHLITERGWPTPRKDWIYRRAEGRIEMIQRIDYDRPLSQRAREELVGEFRVRCPAGVQVVILADHGLGCIGPESLGLIGLAKERRAKIVGIPRTTVLRGQALDAIVLNAVEMRRLAQAGENADPKALAARYAREYNQHVFLTLFEEGVVICPAGMKTPTGTLCEGIPVENADWMGARDITTGIVALGLARGMDLLDIGKLSNVFRHLVASQRGNGRVLWRDVYRFVGLEPSESA
jgi:D-beta-D-heptose 7-phosphate kinase/D-beta-D-heptose 1-phosphate adenosyltransferase